MNGDVMKKEILNSHVKTHRVRSYQNGTIKPLVRVSNTRVPMKILTENILAGMAWNG